MRRRSYHSCINGILPYRSPCRSTGKTFGAQELLGGHYITMQNLTLSDGNPRAAPSSIVIVRDANLIIR